MRLTRYLLPLLIATGLCSSSLFAQRDIPDRGQGSDNEREHREEDDIPLRSFVQSKENIEIKKKSENLEISGDVRFEWNSIQEKGNVIFLDRNRSSSSSSYSDSSFSSSSGSFLRGCPERFSRRGFEFQEKYRSLRGGDVVDTRGLPVSNNDFDVEFNLKIKYTYGRSWMAAHLQFDNPAGAKGNNNCEDAIVICATDDDSSDLSDDVVVLRNNSSGCKGSGEGIFLNLKRAYMGYKIWADGKHRLDIEVGRRKLDDVFDSEIQFGNRFDGGVLKYASAIDKIAEWYWYLAGFIVDERVNHMGYATEIGFLNVFDTNLDLKYSYIDWTKTHRGKNRCFILNSIGSRYKTSQITFDYHFAFDFFSKKKLPGEFYGGFLVNHAATRNPFTCNKKKNLGCYVGLYLGDVQKEGDWSLDIMYQLVQSQAVPDCDANGIERGNTPDEHLTDVIIFLDPVTDDTTLFSDSSSSDSSDFCFDRSAVTVNEFLADLRDNPNVAAYILPGRGNTNFKGWKFEFLYALTDNLSIDTIYQYSHPEDSHIGGAHPFHDFEIEAIYAF